MANTPALYLGSTRALDGAGAASDLHLPAHHLVTHGVVVGMTGSGKTGLTTVMIEEAMNTGVPVLVIDVKGDLPNLLLAFPDFDSGRILPWVEGCATPDETRSSEEIAKALCEQRRSGLEGWRIGAPELARFTSKTEVRVITPGSSAGESLHLLSSLERRSARWDRDPESARGALSAAISLVLRLIGRESDPAKSKEHVLLSLLAERRFRKGAAADLSALLHDLTEPPIDEVGALSLNEFISKTDRRALAAALNTLLASPTFASWREGATLDVDEWLSPKDGRTQAVIVSVAHLEDEERALALGVLLEEVLAWVRSLPGTHKLRALVVFDEVYGFLPPHPANPPTKRPLVALMKQARAFGVGVIVATQNPMDLDYRALSNAGVWCIGRLQTDADRARVMDGLAASIGSDRAAVTELARTVQRLAPRWFVIRDAHIDNGIALLQPRWAMSLLRGPMTRAELQRARMEHAKVIGRPFEAASSVASSLATAKSEVAERPANPLAV
ncbi:MAG TPA: helicase HerA-like domain-containing protein, partial [Polyangiales bacterium]